MLINEEILEIYTSMSKYCRSDISHIGPGWGYVGPVMKGSLIVSSLGMTEEDFHKETRVGDEELKGVNNWVGAKNPKQFGIMMLNGKISSHKSNLTYFPFWIPSNLEIILGVCEQLIKNTGYEITEVVMEKSIDEIGKVSVGFILDDDIECIGEGRSFLASGLAFYKKAWEFNYEYHRPSISEIKSDVWITKSFNGEPTMEFERTADYVREVHDNSNLTRYGSIKDPKKSKLGDNLASVLTGKVDKNSDSYLGFINFMEGKIHIVCKRGPYYERCLF